jgi:Protein of unknown function (DUF3379)
MRCADYRRSMMVDPRDPDPQLREHRDSCHDCQLYTARLLSFESKLERALRVAVPTQTDAPVQADALALADAQVHADADFLGNSAASVVPLLVKPLPQALRSPAYPRRWLAMAASVLLAVVVAGALWLSVPGPSLAADVVTHMGGEPNAWRRTDVPVTSRELQDVLRDSHLSLATEAGMVSYASSCEFRGHRVPHLVIQTASGPVTVMVLVHEQAAKPLRFEDAGYRGVIVPVPGHGSLAVLTRDSATDSKAIEQIAARVLDSIVWTS